MNRSQKLEIQLNSTWSNLLQ